jgi:hypothetical protein
MHLSVARAASTMRSDKSPSAVPLLRNHGPEGTREHGGALRPVRGKRWNRSCDPSF